MSKDVIIVESPGKVKTIQKYLGGQYNIVSSNGHIRDLPSKTFGIDIEKGFEPTYQILPEKKKQVALLQSATKKATQIYLASDDDREGEAIGWHIKEALKLRPNQYKRIVFRSITQKALTNALQNPRDLDMHLIEAQKSRRILDRLVGYKLSPLLWRQIKGRLSAGRVQSVAVRLIVEQERAIQSFKPTPYFKVSATFPLPGGQALKATLARRLESYEEAKDFLEKCKGATFTIEALQTNTIQRAPAPPFMTSTLQQTAGYPVKKTMRLAQSLYEAGKITYMRTDSLNIVAEALAEAKKVIETQYGKDFHQARQYQTKKQHAQEAHEAIRPTSLAAKVASKDPEEQRLYALIWKRILASQMQSATIEKTTAVIRISTLPKEKLIANGEIIRFKGFLAVYDDAEQDNPKALPPLQVQQILQPSILQARESFTKAPPRYTEATLVKKLEALEIGRPSTYSPTISTIQQRGYVERGRSTEKTQTYRLLTLEKGNLQSTQGETTTSNESQKLFPTNVAFIVNDFLQKNFQKIVDYQFTANTELQLDKIAQNTLPSQKMLATFYTAFEKQLQQATSQKESPIQAGMRTLGIDPASQKPVIARLSRRYGPLVQIGSLDANEKPKMASLLKDQLLEQITLEEALELLSLPKTLGQYQEETITLHNGRFGPYLKYQDNTISIKPNNPYEFTLAQAIQYIQQHKQHQTPLKTFEEAPNIQIRHGRFGPYIKTPDQNIRIPKTKDPATLTLEECQALIAAASLKKKKPKARSTPAKKNKHKSSK